MLEYSIRLSFTEGDLPVIDGALAFDTTWAPWGQGRFTVPMEAWDDLGIDPFDRAPVTVHITATDDDGSAAVEWRFLLREVSVNVHASEAVLDIETYELALMETVRVGGDFSPIVPDPFTLGNIFGDVMGAAGLPYGWAATSPLPEIPAYELEPWRNGESAWNYLERYRAMSELSYTIGIEPGTFEFIFHAPTSAIYAPIPTTTIDHRITYMPEQYADALNVDWAWQDSTGTDIRERQSVRATDLASWTDVRRLRTIERLGPPVVGYAQRAVDRMAKHRYQHEVTVPLSHFLLTDMAVPGRYAPNWPARTYNFSEAPTVTGTVIRQFS